jgi:hypothetical protein
MHQPEAPSFGAFWRLARVRAKQHISGVTLLPDHLPGIPVARDEFINERDWPD